MNEIWDIYDINKNKTGRYIYRNSAKMLGKNEYYLVVEAIIINSRGEILLSKRSKSKEKFPLMWECSGGAATKGETSLQAIIREIQEELGINLKNEKAYFYKTIRDDNTHDFKDLWIFKKDVKIEDITFLDGEVIEAKWVNIEEFIKMKTEKLLVPTIDFEMEDYKNIINILN